MSSALKYFAVLDNSTRSNVIVNASNLIPMFNEEEMKCIDYEDYAKHKYDKWFSYNLKRNVNVCYSMTDIKEEHLKIEENVETLISNVIEVLEEFEPVYFLTISTNDVVDQLLKKYKYIKIGQKYMLHVYLNNEYLLQYNIKEKKYKIKGG
jgi:hypothetical protein